MMTLMACYGGGVECPPSVDQDGDGAYDIGCYSQADCNDSDATIYPGAEDPIGDGIDQDCDGEDGSGGSGGMGGTGVFVGTGAAGAGGSGGGTGAAGAGGSGGTGAAGAGDSGAAGGSGGSGGAN